MEVLLKDVLERDMDFLFMEEFISEPEFANLFLKRIGKTNAKVMEVEHSATDVEYGESDITVIVEYESKRHALLIEDKIDAIAMKEQCARYFKRGEKGIQNKKFDGFDVFIVAPQKYLDENDESQKYPNRISYEEILEYFSRETTNRNVFKRTLIETAIKSQQHGYQVKENLAVTDFWNHYIDYKEKFYPDLYLKSKKEPKGSNAKWAHYNIKGWNIPHQLFHKMDKGYVDLTFYGAANKIKFLEKILKEDIPNDVKNDAKKRFIDYLKKKNISYFRSPSERDNVIPLEEMDHILNYSVQQIADVCMPVIFHLDGKYTYEDFKDHLRAHIIGKRPLIR